MNQALTVESRTTPAGVLVLDVAGVLDGHTITFFEPYSRTAVAATAKIVVVHLAGIGFISSAGVGMLISLNHQLRNQNRTLRLAGASASVSEVFDILGLGSVVSIHPDLAGALRAT